MEQTLKRNRDIYISWSGDKMLYVFYSKLKPDKLGIFLIILIRELFGDFRLFVWFLKGSFWL